MDIETEIELEVRIQEAIEALEKEIEEGHEGMEPPESLDGTIGRLSRQDSLMQQEIAKNLQRQRVRRLCLLREAASRMSDGSYGRCVNCNQEIATARLLVAPEVFLCIDCG